ncbi:MAG TPA: hypothetical protein PLY43_00110, partial [Ruminococcus sp.]|nr:hypothetical protein [Ruminococcus sp.]
EIFGKDLLDSPDMVDYFHELTGRSLHKPFECVGSIDEVVLAVSLAIRKMKESGQELPLLMRDFEGSGLYQPETLDQRNAACCGYFSENNLLPDSFRAILTKEMERLL